MKRGRGLFIIIGVVLILFIVVQVTGPQPINWQPSFSQNHKYPFGGYILHERLTDIFPGQPIRTSEVSAYEMLEDVPEAAGTVNYLIVTDLFETDQREARHLMDFVEKGNQVFIAANVFAGSFADTFDVATGEGLLFGIGTGGDYSIRTDADTALLTFQVKQGVEHTYFSTYPRSLDTEELGFSGLGEANFVRIGYGKGNFYLHSGPMLFTNFNLLYDKNYDYVERVLSHLPQQPVLWDEYYKPGRARTGTPLKYILQTEGLRWAWLLLLPSLVLYILFSGKRRQRIIPVMAPPRNDSLEFTETIGRLYWEHGDHLDLARKKVRYLFEYIRTRFYMETRNVDAKFIERLAHKSGVSEPEVRQLFQFIQQLEGMNGLSESSLLQLNTLIDDFYERSK